MPDRKLTQLPVLAALSADDIFYVVDDPAGAANSRQIAASVFDARYLQTANNLSDLTNVVIARASLGLGTLAVINSPLPIANGGSGQVTQQAAIDALTNVVAATNEYVLTKDTGTGNAIYKAVTVLPVVDETPLVYETGVPANTLTFDVTAYTAARVAAWPDATFTVAGLQVANVFTAIQKVNINSTAALLIEQDGVNDNVLIVDTTNNRVGLGIVPTRHFQVSGPSTQLIEIASTSANSAVGYLFANGNQSWSLMISKVSAGNLSIYDETGVKEVMRFAKTSNYVSINAAAPATRLHIIDTTATTNAVLNVVTIGANVTDAGVGAAGFGPGIALQGESSTTADTNMARLAALWQTATHNTAVADLVAQAYYNNGGTFTASEIWRGRAGAAPLFGVLGATPVIRQAHIADPAGGGTQDAEARTAINSILNVLEAFGFVATS